MRSISLLRKYMAQFRLSVSHILKSALLIKLSFRTPSSKNLSLDRVGFLKPEALSVVQVRAVRYRMFYTARTCLYFAAVWDAAIWQLGWRWSAGRRIRRWPRRSRSETNGPSSDFHPDPSDTKEPSMVADRSSLQRYHERRKLDIEKHKMKKIRI